MTGLARDACAKLDEAWESLYKGFTVGIPSFLMV
jgi:hypothetical protein